MIIAQKSLTVARPLKYIQNECKNDKRLAQFINQLMIGSVKVIIGSYFLITYLLNMVHG